MRERTGLLLLERVAEDLRHALRGLRRAPGFTAAVVLTLGLGVGANAAIFDVVDRLMFRPAPYLRDPGRVHRVYLQDVGRERTVTRSAFPYTRFLDLRRGTRAFSRYAAVAHRPMAIGTGEAAREWEVAGVSASLFDFFDARPALGRFFVAGEDSAPRGASVAVLSHAFWLDAFGGANVLGRPLQVGTVTTTIVGVAPEGFEGFADGPPPAVFIPITTFPEAAAENKTATFFLRYDWDWTSVFVRRRPGVGEAAASAQLTAAYERSREAQLALGGGGAPAGSLPRYRAIAGAPRVAAGPDAGLEPRTLLWVTGVAAIVLVIAAANVANLLLARALRRRRETAVRLALGVRRGRLVAQALAEGAVLALLAAVAGLVVAKWGGAALRLAVLHDAGPAAVGDPRTLAVAAACAIGAGLFAALAPALLSERGDLSAALRAGARDTAAPSRARAALLVAQAALSVVLLVGAGLFVRSFDNVRAMRLGYDVAPVLVAVPNARGLRLDSAATVALRRRLLAAAQRVPGVRAAARIDFQPFGTSSARVFTPGVDSTERFGRFDLQVATADYFAVMGTRVVRGRPFTAADDSEGAARVVVVSHATARALWPNEDALGRCVRLGADTAPCATVVGVAEDAVQNGITDDRRQTLYVPLDQYAPAWGNRIAVRAAAGDAAAIAEPVRRALQAAMPGEGYVTVTPLAELVDGQRRSWRLGATMFVALGGLALAVAAVGLYGVVAYDVAQRTRELGIRVALGATARDVVRLVLGRGVAFALAGVAMGLGAALVGARWLQPLLFAQSARDPAVYGGVGAVLVAVAALASALPARRAAGADPNVALRAE